VNCRVKVDEDDGIVGGLRMSYMDLICKKVIAAFTISHLVAEVLSECGQGLSLNGSVGRRKREDWRILTVKMYLGLNCQQIPSN
jgi:hypothetical protein